MRAVTITTMQIIEDIVHGQGITTPVIWVAAVHDDHTDKNHVQRPGLCPGTPGEA